ncbi:MAG: hypothetical protein ACP5G1_04240 [Nanopusillaceae archaeon]
MIVCLYRQKFNNFLIEKKMENLDKKINNICSASDDSLLSAQELFTYLLIKTHERSKGNVSTFGLSKKNMQKLIEK